MDRIELLQSMVEKDKSNIQAWYMLGEELLQQENLREALYAFSMALAENDYTMEQNVIAYLSKVFSSLEGQSRNTDEENAYNLASVRHVEDDDQPNPDEVEKTVELTVIHGKKTDNISSLKQYQPKTVTFQDVGGLDSLKKTINMKIIKPFMDPGLFTKFRKKTGGGILLFGPPGCGKTFIAKATAGEIGANFFPVHISDILDPFFGQSERNLHDVFKTARANRPSVLFFDEVDTLGYSRSKANSDIMRPLIDSMLTEMESIDTGTDNLLIIGATNMPWDVDSAFKRPGRFDKLVFVPPPDMEARQTIFQLKLKEKPLSSDISLEILATKTEYYSGADIENVIELATENVLTEIMETNQERLIGMEDLLYAIEETIPSTLEWLQTIKNYIKYSNQTGLYKEVAKYINKVLL
ncbi:AAA family ATPase [Ornithinibacillus sp. L9]|uniref:AAA family ATPase n=1 Tax=Ornithinibacillus caprae TaxID=2678566 RepID=A0A6N8FKG5_9BACI|nr:ATP-binding protein [Ornithinibacillus caprae]MUK89206.1 AAA family ATPase [Ornithinibacillus caprae]